MGLFASRRRPCARHAIFYQAVDNQFYAYGGVGTWCVSWLQWFSAAGWLLPRERGAAAGARTGNLDAGRAASETGVDRGRRSARREGERQEQDANPDSLHANPLWPRWLATLPRHYATTV
jgi:hypothetical protein